MIDTAVALAWILAVGLAGGCGSAADDSCEGGSISVQATTGVTSEAHTITVTHGSCEKTLTFAAGSMMGEIKTAFELDLKSGATVRFAVDLGGVINAKVCTVSSEAELFGYVRGNATPAGVPECGCGTLETTDSCL